ncbi:conserved hypothetical protein [Arthrobacter sp. Hiyo8]|nr:conserved hypothetical protein [Arthrobacter sp. Hiyo8]
MGTVPLRYRRSDRTMQALRRGPGLRETMVYVDAPGIVVRCASCEGVLLRLVETPTRYWLDVSGLSYLQIDREG